MKSKLSVLALSLIFMNGAFAAQEIQCRDACAITQDDTGCNVVKFDISDSRSGQVTWINASNDSVVETASLIIRGNSKKHPGYTVYSGEDSEGSARDLFELPADLVGKTGQAKFIGYFYDLENDGGPDVPLGFTMNCEQK